jgi:hypothetical protein
MIDLSVTFFQMVIEQMEVHVLGISVGVSKKSFVKLETSFPHLTCFQPVTQRCIEE